MKQIFSFLVTNWDWLGPVIYALVVEITLRLWPTKNNISIIDNLWKIFNKIIPNVRVPQPDDEIIETEIDAKTKKRMQRNKIIANVARHVLTVLTLLVFMNITVHAQIWQNYKGIRLINQYEDTTDLPPIEGSMFYDYPNHRFLGRTQFGWKPFMSGGSAVSGIVGAANGLTATGDTVRLGGMLSANTTLNLNNRALNFDGGGGGNFSVKGMDSLLLYNPAGTFAYRFVPSAFTGNRVITIPNTASNAELMLNNVSQVTTNKNLSSGTLFSAAPTIQDGVKFTFNPTDISAGINVGANAIAPFSPINGDIYYNSTSNTLQGRINSAWVNLGGGGITNTAAANEIPKSDGTNIIPSGIFNPSSGNITMGSGSIAGATRNLVADGSATNVGFTIAPKGASKVLITNTDEINNSVILELGTTTSGGEECYVQQFPGKSLNIGESTSSLNLLTTDLGITNGANNPCDIAVLVGGTVTVNHNKIQSGTIILLTHQNNSGTPGFVSVTSRVVGTSFTITSSSPTDTSTIGYLIIN